MMQVIAGLMNSGKTLYMTKKLYEDYLKGNTIYTNYHLYFPPSNKGNKIFLIDQKFLLGLAQNNYIMKDCSFGLDEFWIMMDSRNAGSSNVNKMLSYFLNQTSKDNTILYMTSQHILQTDVRVRKNLHRITQCSRQLLVGNQFKKINDDYRKLPPNITKDLYIRADTFKPINIGLTPMLNNATTEYIKADKYYHLYNTSEKIKPVI